MLANKDIYGSFYYYKKNCFFFYLNGNPYYFFIIKCSLNHVRWNIKLWTSFFGKIKTF